MTRSPFKRGGLISGPQSRLRHRARRCPLSGANKREVMEAGLRALAPSSFARPRAASVGGRAMAGGSKGPPTSATQILPGELQSATGGGGNGGLRCGREVRSTRLGSPVLRRSPQPKPPVGCKAQPAGKLPGQRRGTALSGQSPSRARGSFRASGCQKPPSAASISQRRRPRLWKERVRVLRLPEARQQQKVTYCEQR